MKYAQILNGLVHAIFESENVLEYAANIVIVDISEIYPPPSVGDYYNVDNGLFVAPQYPLTDIKSSALKTINQRRDERIYAGVKFPASSGQVFETDEKSQLKIAGAVAMALLAAQAGVPFEQPWILKDNSTTLLSGPLMMGLGQAVGVHVGTHTVQAQGYKNQIDAAQTAAEIAAIVEAYRTL